jgi:hypothetical protein
MTSRFPSRRTISYWPQREEGELCDVSCYQRSFSFCHCLRVLSIPDYCMVIRAGKKTDFVIEQEALPP